MSFLFALLQLASFASIDDDRGAVDRDIRADPIEQSTPSRSSLLQRPIVTPCVGNGCR